MNKEKLVYWVLVAFTVFSGLSYLSVLIPPTIFWPGIFASYAIPGVLIFNFILLPIIPFYKKKWTIFPFMGLLGGLPFLFVTYSHHEEKILKNQEISILSLNAKLFRKAKMYNEFSGELIEWTARDSSDIKCFQEYSTNARWEPLDVTKKIMDQGYMGYTHRSEMDDSPHNAGLAIFSKYPIINRGIVWTQPGSMNDGIFADVKIGKDTIRIYNVHLASMQLMLYQYKYADNYPGKMKRLVSRLKYGAERRSFQIDKLMAHTKSCPYPFIICGDFNETPYSYNYFMLKRKFSNAFEEAGNGFGFSLNSILFFLRIDHHFYSPGIEATKYRIDRNMKVSDHFPTRGVYRIGE